MLDRKIHAAVDAAGNVVDTAVEGMDSKIDVDAGAHTATVAAVAGMSFVVDDEESAHFRYSKQARILRQT
jgi:hypothetical protein